MDGSTFCHGTALFDDEIDPGRGLYAFMCIFDFNVDQLERASLRHAKCYVHDPNDAQPIPQRGLVKFVRRATNLRWFRSDLTPENVAMLQLERPDVTFVS
jgi:hypothetical protein